MAGRQEWNILTGCSVCSSPRMSDASLLWTATSPISLRRALRLLKGGAILR